MNVWWRNEAGEELTVPVHMLVDCTTLIDERRQWCIGGFAWVPCAERAPNPNVEVLVHDEHHQCVLATIDSSGQWHDTIGGMWLTEVTHWMPLPPLPERAGEP